MDLASMMITITKIVILPILLGVIFHKFLSKKIEFVTEILPMVSLLVSDISIIIATVVAMSKATILDSVTIVFKVIFC
ncbi:hypothetical protein [Psychrobacter sp. NPDC078631]|uniref:hypothetical protein n=1 Tax=Psychrobacter sp. NPDC078631 TaxID=3390666 RepID=UPI003CFEA9E1